MKYSVCYSLGLSLLCCFLLFSNFRMLAQQELLLSINELFTLGTENSLKLQASQLHEVIAEEQFKGQRNKMLPDIQLGVKGGVVGQPIIFQEGLSHPSYPNIPHWFQNYGIEFAQPIYQGGKIRSEISKADIQRKITSLNSANSQAEIKLTLLKSYIDLFSFYKQRKVLKRNIEESERRLRDISQMKLEGVLTRNDELRSELQLTNYRLALQEADNSILIISQQLNILLGLEESMLIVPDTTLLNTSLNIYSYETYLQQAMKFYPGMQIAQESNRLAKNEIETVQASYRPSVSLYAVNNLSRPISSTLANFYNNNWSIGLSLSYSISSIYQNKHRMEVVRQSIKLRKNEEEQLVQELRIRIKEYYLRHHEALERVETLKLSLKQAEENYRIVQNRYMNQLSVMTELLDASSVRLEAELQLTVARTQTLYTYYQLLRVCGEL